jgi:hypothetical protein
MKLENLNDLLTINTDTLKSPEKGRLLTRIKQLIKAEIKSVDNADDIAKDLPYEAVSIVGNQYIEIKFDLLSKSGRIVSTATDTRDTRGKNYMAGAKAIKKLQELVKNQKEIINE